LLQESGFESIGMDHFALLTDKLFSAAANGSLNRNFMGYTTTQSKLIIGLGVSSISDSWHAFAQNEKTVEVYMEKIDQGVLPLVNGHVLSEKDIIIRKNILELMCENKTRLDSDLLEPRFIHDAFSRLENLAADDLVVINKTNICVTTRGRSFIRNIIAAIDPCQPADKSDIKMFSNAI